MKSVSFVFLLLIRKILLDCFAFFSFSTSYGDRKGEVLFLCEREAGSFTRSWQKMKEQESLMETEKSGDATSVPKMGRIYRRHRLKRKETAKGGRGRSKGLRRRR